jgi:hypothetical protein
MEEASDARCESIRIPAIGAPIKYPGVQKEVIRLIDAAADPGASVATAVGKATKKLPLAQPLIMAKTKSGGKDELTGQMASIDTLLTKAAKANALKAPIRSQIQPPANRPTAVDAPNPATSPAPVEAERPMDLAKTGRKNGGTNKANTPTAPAIARVRKGMLFSCDQSNRDVELLRAKSLRNNAQGIPVARIENPRIRNVHCSPTLLIIA